jgi:hypothetical protein
MDFSSVGTRPVERIGAWVARGFGPAQFATAPPPASTASFAVARPVRGDKYIKSSNAIRKTSITIILPMQHVAKIEVVVF